MPKLISEKQIFKIKLLRNILIVSLSVATGLSFYNIFIIYPSFTDLLIESTKNDSVRSARHLASMFFPEQNELKENSFNVDLLKEIQNHQNDFDLMKIKVYSKSGKTLFSTDVKDVGVINELKYFHEIVALGKVHTELVPKDTVSLEGQIVTLDVVETYVPLMNDTKFQGAFEIYHDITDRKKQLDNLTSKSTTVLVSLTVGLLFAIIIIFFKENKTTAERRAAEAALRESEEQLSGILNSFTDLIIVVDRDLNITWSNHVAEKFFGTDPVGKKCYDVFHFRNTPCTTCDIEKCFADGQGVENEVEYIGPNGSRLDLWYTAGVAARSEDGVPSTVIVVYRDITEKKLLQAETARTGQLASIGELAAGVAHEINNPINGIINCAQLLIDESPEDSSQAEISARIIKAGSRIAMIVRNLLSFARDHKDAPDLTHIKSILSDSLDLTETQIRKDGIDFSINIPGEIPKVTVRRHQIQQVFLNIISNARYALNKKFPAQNNNKVFAINAEVVNINSGKYVRINFYDNGTGIPADILDRICDPFFSTKPIGEGTGLGLSISQSIIKDHGGRLRFESSEGDFTNIIVDLPVAGEDNWGDAI
jgi:PAS domain S-box-containing protein